MAKKKPKKNQKPAARNPSIPAWLMKMIDSAWPEERIDFSLLELEESNLASMIDKIGRDLRQAEQSVFFFEKPPISDDMPYDYDNKWEEEPPPESDLSRSYHLFFVGPLGEAFEKKTETEPQELADDEENGWDTVACTSHFGWIVAISYVAPLAIVHLGSVDVFDDGSISHSEPHRPSPDDEPAAEDQGETQLTEGARSVLSKMRQRIVATLEKRRIPIIGPALQKEPVDWLSVEEETLIPYEYDSIRVFDVFFFQAL